MIRDITKGKGADLTLDLVGVDATLLLAAAVARPTSDVVLVGVGMGSFPFSFFTTPYEVSFHSTYWGSVSELHRGRRCSARPARSSPPGSSGTPSNDAMQAYTDMAAGTLHGRAVIVP